MRNRLPPDFSAAVSLGEGGQARTWLAWQEDPGRWVVIKTDPRDRGELRAEAELLERLPGAPVPALLAKDLETHRPWIAMSWIDGVRLDSLPTDLDDTEILSLVSAAARSVGALHSRSIVHGDLSPANLLALPTGEVLAVDLGMASFGEAHLGGTWETFSPERLQGKPASPASDIFALGVLTLRLLGRLPEPWTSSREEWTLAVLEEALPALAHDIPILARAVDALPENRPSAIGLAQGLGVLGGSWPHERLRRKAQADLDVLLRQAIEEGIKSKNWNDAWRWQRERIERSEDPEPLLPDLGRFAREREAHSRRHLPWLALAGFLALASAVLGFTYFQKHKAVVAPAHPDSTESVHWEDPRLAWPSNPVESFKLPSPPPGASLQVDGLPTDMPLDGILLLSRGRHRIQLRDAVGIPFLDTIWLGARAIARAPGIPPSHTTAESLAK